MEYNWEISFDLVMEHEGGFTNDQRDPGNKLPDGREGSTNLGLTQKNWEAHLGRKVTQDDMKALTTEDVKPLYKKYYWDAVKGDDLPDGIDYAIFDFAINSGPNRAVKVLQIALQVTPDGAIGPKTLKAIQDADADELLAKFSKAKEDFYKSLPTFSIYGKGWLRRVAEVQTLAQSFIA